MRKILVREVVSYLKSEKIEIKAEGNREIWFDSYSSLDSLTDRKITWVKYWAGDTIKKLEGKKETVIIGRFEDAPEPVNGSCHILCEDPKMCYFKVLRHFFMEKKDAVIAETAIIKTMRIGSGCSVGEYSILGNDVVLGNDVTIGSHVILQGKVEVGSHCLIASGTIIGKAGFGYYRNQEGHMEQVPHLGGVTIGDYVEIGANTCIDCGTLDNTVIGSYCKIDNLCHIGHNVRLSQDVMVVAGSVICGSCVIGKGSYISPGAVIKNQTYVGEGSFVGMQTAVIRDMKPQSSVFGVPGKPFKREYTV